MCGIAAIYSYSSSAPVVDEVELLRIRESMVNRGPDGAGLWISNNHKIGLAHRRLAIIDLSDTASQPMATADETLRIVFNGEIYNYKQIRRDLEIKGYRFQTRSDTEVLLHLYREYGEAFVSHLRGMYAIVIWDENKKGIFLARDPYGIKPLYYADNGKTLRIASQVKALLRGGAVDTTPEPAGHVGFFIWGHVPEPYTLYKGIRALPAGTSLWLDASGKRNSKQFFSISKSLASAEESYQAISYEEMLERLRAALLDSVSHHLVADVPVGVFLSSGLDSTTLVALAREQNSGLLRTITLGFNEYRGSAADEAPLAEKVASHYGTAHETCWVTKEDFVKERETLLSVMDQPSIDGVNSYFVSRAASQAGLKVALSGLGGDELFGGYQSFQQIPQMGKLFSPLANFPSIGRGFRYISAPILKQLTSPKYASLFEYGGSSGGGYLLRRGLYLPWELPSIMDADMAKLGWDELQTLSRLEETTAGIKNSHLKVSALEMSWYMRNQLLRDSDWASMAHSLEIRVPLVDIELMQKVAPLINSSVPPNKNDMASSPSRALPKSVLQRKKTGFTVPIREWLMARGASSNGNRSLRGWALSLNKTILKV